MFLVAESIMSALEKFKNHKTAYLLRITGYVPEYKNISEVKRLHDMLACHEGIAYINGEDTFCKYETVKPYNEGLCGTMTKWGSTKTRATPYREVLAAVGYKKS